MQSVYLKLIPRTKMSLFNSSGDNGNNFGSGGNGNHGNVYRGGGSVA